MLPGVGLYLYLWSTFDIIIINQITSACHCEWRLSLWVAPVCQISEKNQEKSIRQFVSVLDILPIDRFSWADLFVWLVLLSLAFVFLSVFLLLTILVQSIVSHATALQIRFYYYLTLWYQNRLIFNTLLIDCYRKKGVMEIKIPCIFYLHVDMQEFFNDNV